MKTLSALAAALAAPLALAACVETTAPGAGAPAGPEQLALFGSGYPNPGDPCRRSGETAVTSAYLDDAADLVACPPTTDPGLFASSTGGRQVARVDGWYLFSIPRR